MLEQKDLQAIAELIDARVGRTEEVLIGKINTLEEKTEVLSGKVDKLEEKTEVLSSKIEELEEKITDVERSLVNELVRTEDKLIRRIEKIENELEELNQYYRIHKLENDNIGMILQILEGYDKRLRVLEKKIA